MSRAESVVRMWPSSWRAAAPQALAYAAERACQACSSVRRAGDVLRPVGPEVSGVAGQRGLAGPDTARVETDPVVGPAHVLALEVLADHPAERRVREARASGAAGVDQHDALVLGCRRGVQDARHGQLDRPAAGVRVVEGNRDEPAPCAGLAEAGVAAAAPADRCRGSRGRADSGGAARCGGDQAGGGQAQRGGESSQLHGSPIGPRDPSWVDADPARSSRVLSLFALPPRAGRRPDWRHELPALSRAEVPRGRR